MYLSTTLGTWSWGLELVPTVYSSLAKAIRPSCRALLEASRSYPDGLPGVSLASGKEGGTLDGPQDP